nr:MAG TPA: hypothetical protein [Caudoviricetes sp.]
MNREHSSLFPIWAPYYLRSKYFYFCHRRWV